ncbi:unnamed protein product, partial [marine sediment metagenome]
MALPSWTEIWKKQEEDKIELSWDKIWAKIEIPKAEPIEPTATAMPSVLPTGAVSRIRGVVKPLDILTEEAKKLDIDTGIEQRQRGIGEIPEYSPSAKEWKVMDTVIPSLIDIAIQTVPRVPGGIKKAIISAQGWEGASVV